MTEPRIEFFESSHRYKVDGEFVVSVTTALKGIPKDALVRWAAKTVAEHAVDKLATVAATVDAMGTGPAVAMLASVPESQRDTAAVRGTEIHEIAERYIRGEAVEVPAELMPYVRGYARYVDDYEPESVYDEIMVANTVHGYAGKLDSLQRVRDLHDGLVLVDYKTSRKLRGQYALQCAAYRYAEFAQLPDGTCIDMPSVENVYILHIRPDAYDLVPVDAGPITFQRFLVAKENYLLNVQSDKLEKLIGQPLVRPPVTILPTAEKRLLTAAQLNEMAANTRTGVTKDGAA